MKCPNDRNRNIRQRLAIRLTDERWAHITEEHSELAGMRFEVLETIVQPWRIYEEQMKNVWRFEKLKTANFWWRFIVKWMRTDLLSRHF